MPSFAQNLERTLHNALSNASERRHEYATLEHLLLALIDDEDAAQVMGACGVDLAELGDAGLIGDVRALVRAGVAPLFEACLEKEGRLYARFSAQIISDPRYDLPTLVKDVDMKSVTSVGEHLLQSIDNVPDTILRLRLRRLFTMSVMIMADYARQVEDGSAAPVEEAIDEATTSLTGFLLA